MNHDFSQFKRVVVYRFGSLGDTLVVLPGFHLVRQAFPKARITLLTNIPVHAKAAPMEAVLSGGEFYHDVLRYRVSLRKLAEFVQLRKVLKEGAYDCLVYLAAPKGGVITSIRDYVFFRLCGIRLVIGVPFSRPALRSLPIPGTSLFASRTSRAVEALSPLGRIDLADPRAWDLRLTKEEIAESEALLGRFGITLPFLAVSAGTKMTAKDWEEHNWAELVQRLAAEYPDLPLVLFGVSEERERSEHLMRIWKGPGANLCGLTSPRVGAAVLRSAKVMVCHDSGPMHLAATMGVPSVAIFSARAKPGEWFPRGDNHVVIYHKTPCWDCGLEECIEKRKVCILSITVDEVFEPVVQQLARRGVFARSESARRVGTSGIRDGLASGVRSFSPSDFAKARRALSSGVRGAAPGSSGAGIGPDVRFHPVPQGEARGQVMAMMRKAGCAPPADFRYIIHGETDSRAGNRRIAVELFCELCRATDQQGLWLVLVGEPLEGDLRNAIGEAGLRERIAELGGVGHQELCALYSAAELLFLPSSEETVTRRIIEAQACGCPVATMGRRVINEVDAAAMICLDPADYWSSLETLLNLLYCEKDSRTKSCVQNLPTAALSCATNPLP